MSATSIRPTVAIRIAAGLAGYCSFVNLYSPQAILPLLSSEFGAGAADISHIMTAGTLAVALMAPFSGTVADVIGRKRIIVCAMFVLAIPTIMIALSPSLHAFTFWRFVQGLTLPPIFAVTIAYIGEELPPREATTVVGSYMSGASLGGFSGRFFTGVLADMFGWRYAFASIAVATLIFAIVVWRMLPTERKFVRSEGLLASGRQMLRHFRNPRLIATYAVGFCVLFNFIGVFTFINFRLAAPPYNLSPSWLGAIFVVYLVGSGLANLVGWAVGRFGRRHFVLGTIALWICGCLLTLLEPLWAILLGLTICAASGLLCQAVSTSYVAVTAQVGRSSAVGLYVTCFNLGGSFGAFLTGIAWTFGGWPACVALILVVLSTIGVIVTFAWPRDDKAAPPPMPPPLETA